MFCFFFFSRPGHCWPFISSHQASLPNVRCIVPKFDSKILIRKMALQVSISTGTSRLRLMGGTCRCARPVHDFETHCALAMPRPEHGFHYHSFLSGVGTLLKHTFSAFWLRSSVVSVLISLISGTWRMASHEFK